MAQFPVSLKPKPYRGSDAKKLEKYKTLCRIAVQISDYINSQEDKTEVSQIFTYDSIADSINVDESFVSEVLVPTSASANGITIFCRRGGPEPNMTNEVADEDLEPQSGS